MTNPQHEISRTDLKYGLAAVLTHRDPDQNLVNEAGEFKLSAEDRIYCYWVRSREAHGLPRLATKSAIAPSHPSVRNQTFYNP